MRSVKLVPAMQAAGLDHRRRGGILVLASAFLVALFAFTAFVVDVGYITLTKAELGKTADGAALAAANELPDGYGSGATTTSDGAVANGRSAAVAVASANEAGGHSSTYLDGTRDVRFGKYQWDEASDQWVKSWGATPYNMAEVTVHRDVTTSSGASSSAGDGPLDLFFAPVLGTRRAGTRMKSTAAMLPAVGFKIIPESGLNSGILPIALDLDTWQNLIDYAVGSDNYSYNEATGVVSAGGDGVREVNLYPEANVDLPPGNRGTVDIGPTNNSTADLSRQILHGISQSDLDSLAEQGIELRWDNGPIVLNGDPGLSAGIKDELDAIKGTPRAIPIFSAVSGNGNNAQYTIVKFVPIRVMYAQLTGKPSSKRVIIQPAAMVDATFVTGNTVIRNDSMFGPATLIP
jgi:Flp pilus assembly protein TadG